MPADPIRVQSLFASAKRLLDPQARAAFLDEECGTDTELRREVDALLRSIDSPSSMSDDLAPTVDSAGEVPKTQDIDDPLTQVGAVLAGKYTLIEEIGSGGMGSVYLAQQTDPVKRRVAVKVVKAGMDSREILGRFEAERQALALMDHPNIAKVLDAGATDEGRPFFVMELVRGVPITQFCDDRKLTLRQRLEIFVPVCQAIQHAHQKGIVHRDIKPSNVLVSSFDGNAVPKVIDFGVAKATGMTLTEMSIVTGLGAVVGTPEYMSPEQAHLNNLDIDSRSDVYSLGVLLYQLLTGTTPVDRKSLGQAALLEILRIVREVEAPRPSSKLSSIDTLPSIAANRNTDPSKLPRVLEGELDWVLLKSLEKDRERRYETANALARDIQRYLADEVVEARPPTARYRLMKLVRRNKLQFSAASLVVLALVLGVIGTSIGFYRSDKSRRSELKQRKLAERKTQEAETERNNAQAAATRERLALTEVRSAKAETEEALVQARENEQLANRLRENAEVLLEKAEQSAYVGDVVSAQYALDNGAALVPELLEARWDLRGWEHKFLTGKMLPESFAHLVQASRVTSIEFNHADEQVAVGGVDGQIRLWQLRKSSEPELLKTIQAHQETVSSLVFTSDGKRLISGGYDQLIKVWDVTSGEHIRTLEGHNKRIRSVSVSRDGTKIASGSGDLTVRVWQLDSGEELLQLAGHQGEIRSVDLSDDGALVASGSADGTIKLWDTSTGEELRTIRGHKAAVASVDLDSQAEFLVSGSWDKSVKLWTVRDGTLVRDFKGHSNMVMAVAFMGDGKRIASAGWDSTLRLWELDTGKQIESIDVQNEITDLSTNAPGSLVAVAEWNLQTSVFEPGSQNPVYRGHEQPLTAVAVSPDDKEVASLDGSGVLNVWSLESRQNLLQIQLAAAPVGFLSFSPDGQEIYTSDIRNVVSVWSRKNGELVKECPGLCVSPNGKFVVGYIDKHIRLFDLEYLEELWATPYELDFPQFPPMIAFTEDSTRLALGQVTIAVLDVDDGTESFRVDNSDVCSCIKFDPQGKRLLTVGAGTLLRVWDGLTGKPIISRFTSAVSLEFNPSGDRIFLGTSASGRGTIEIWSASSFVRLLRLRKHGATISDLEFTSDGNTLVSSSHDHEVRLWDGSKSLALSTGCEHAGAVTGVAYCPPAERAVTASWDGRVNVFDTSKGRIISSFAKHDCPVTGVTLSQDGKFAVSRGLDGRVLFWELGTGAIIDSLQLPDGTDDASKVRTDCIAVSGDMKRLLCSHHDGRVTLWDRDANRDRPIFEQDMGTVTALDLSKDGKILAVASEDLIVRLLDADQGSLVTSFDQHNNRVLGLTLSDDKTQLSSISHLGDLISWDLNENSVEHQFETHVSQASANTLAETSLTKEARDELPAFNIQFGGDRYHYSEAALGTLRIKDIEYDEITEEMAKKATN